LWLAHEIIRQVGCLVEDQFGNYLVQNVLKLKDDHCYELILREIAKDFIRLSKMKFSSNVIEICFSTKSKSKRQIEKIFKGTFPDDDWQIV